MSDVTAISSWYGSNRILADEVGKRLNHCNHVSVPFAGGLSEVLAMTARTINVNDKHWHVINLAQVLGDRECGPKVYRRLRRIPFHPQALRKSQEFCQDLEPKLLVDSDRRMTDEQRMEWAFHYFICSWVARHSLAGTRTEFRTGISTRWSAGGGDSAAHYWGATRGIPRFWQTLRRCNFTCECFRVFLPKVQDKDKHGIYVDAPFFGAGDKYKFPFTRLDHFDLRDHLSRFENATVVIRYYDIPLIRELYPQAQWTWEFLAGRKQTNETAPEVLIMN